MDAKRILLTLMIFFLVGANPSMAGKTTFGGPTRCVMPNLFEFQSQTIEEDINTSDSDAEAPKPSGASGKYEVQKEEKLIQTEENTTHQEESEESQEVIVYSICAR